MQYGAKGLQWFSSIGWMGKVSGSVIPAKAGIQWVEPLIRLMTQRVCGGGILPTRRKPRRHPSFLQEEGDALTLTLSRRERGFVTHPLMGGHV